MGAEPRAADNAGKQRSRDEVMDARQRPLTAILVGGLLAGALDITSAFVTYGWNTPKGIAAGLVGRATARAGGIEMWILGMFLHFFITCVAAAVYWTFSRRLVFLRQYPFVCGLFFGIAVWLVMNLIVLPLSAIHARDPIPLGAMIQGLLVHMFFVGLPISYSVSYFEKRAGLRTAAA
jgi:hypothetical protein